MFLFSFLLRLPPKNIVAEDFADDARQIEAPLRRNSSRAQTSSFNSDFLSRQQNSNVHGL
jgi:hypothetical protein